MSSPEDDLKRHTQQRMAEMGKNAAADIAAREARAALRARIPRFLWPLIPGQGGSMEANVDKLVKRKTSDLIWSIGCTVGFFVIFGGAVLVMAAFIVYALWSSGHLF